jgi:hypothetical protein
METTRSEMHASGSGWTAKRIPWIIEVKLPAFDRRRYNASSISGPARDSQKMM